MSENLKNIFIKNTFWTYFLSYLTAPFGLLLKIIYSKNLSIEEFGLFYMIIGFYSFISIFNDLGFTETLKYYGTKFLIKKNYKDLKLSYYYALIMQLISGLIISLIIIFFNNFFSKYWFHNQNAGIILNILLIYFIAINLLNPMLNLFMIKLDLFWNKLFKLIFLLSILILSIINFYFIPFFNVDNIINLSIIWSFVTLIILIFYFYKINKIFKSKFSNIKINFSKKLYSKLLKYAIPVIIGSIGGILLNTIDIQMIGILSNSKNVAYYETSLSLSNIIFFLIAPISSFIFPLTTKLITENKKKELNKIISYIYNYFLIVSIPITLIFIIYYKFIFNLFFNSNYFYSFYLFISLLFSIIFSIFYVFNFQILSGLKLVKERNKIIFISGISNIILNILFYNLFGFVGIAYSTLLINIFIFILTLRLIKIKGINIKINNIFKIFFNNILFYFILKFLIILIKTKYLYLNIVLILLFSFSFYIIIGDILKLYNIKKIILFLKNNLN